jgi:hypothetical protein
VLIFAALNMSKVKTIHFIKQFTLMNFIIKFPKLSVATLIRGFKCDVPSSSTINILLMATSSNLQGL